jgi:hypothetical protein
MDRINLDSLSGRRALPLSSFSVSSGPSGSVFSHSVPGRFSGERVIDREQDSVDIHLHHAAHERSVGKKPLVVIQKCSQKMLLPYLAVLPF